MIPWRDLSTKCYWNRPPNITGWIRPCNDATVIPVWLLLPALWSQWDWFSLQSVITIKAATQPVECRGLVMPGATASLCAPYQILIMSSGVWWSSIVTGYTLFVTSQYDLIFTFPNQRLGEVCWHNMQIILHALSLLVVVQRVTVMNIKHQRSKLGDRSKTQQLNPKFVTAEISGTVCL